MQIIYYNKIQQFYTNSQTLIVPILVHTDYFTDNKYVNKNKY